MIRCTSTRTRQLGLRKGIFNVFALLIALGLKYHYSRAGSKDLEWILGSTTCLVEHLSGIQFEDEANTGFINRRYRVIIAPSYAGINFLIIVFWMTIFCGIHVIRHFGSKPRWLTARLACAYSLTIAVNTLRIIASIYSFHGDIYFGWMTPARAHRLEGVVIYFFFLCLFYIIIKKASHRI